MRSIGCNLHARQQSLALPDTVTGDVMHVLQCFCFSNLRGMHDVPILGDCRFAPRDAARSTQSAKYR
jgi:hypothetical protein